MQAQKKVQIRNLKKIVALVFLIIGAGCGRVVNSTPRPLYPRKYPDILPQGDGLTLKSNFELLSNVLNRKKCEPYETLGILLCIEFTSKCDLFTQPYLNQYQFVTLPVLAVRRMFMETL